MYNTEALRRLQEVDLEIARLGQQIEEKRRSPGEREGHVKKLRALGERAKADLAAAEKARRAIELELSALADERKKAEAKLKLAQTPKMAEASEKELAALDARKKAIEDRVLSAMEKEEEARGLLKKAEGAAKDTAKRIEGEVASLPDAVKDIEARIQTKKGEREKWRGQVEAQDLARYDQLSARIKGRVVVEVERACSACDAYFAPGDLESYMAATDRVHQCRNCGRLMIYVGARSL